MLWWASILKPSHLMIHQVHLEHLRLKPFLHQVQPSTGPHLQILVVDQSQAILSERENSAQNGIVLITTQHQISTMSSLGLGKAPVMNLEFLLVLKQDLDNLQDHLYHPAHLNLRPRLILLIHLEHHMPPKLERHMLTLNGLLPSLM